MSEKPEKVGNTVTDFEKIVDILQTVLSDPRMRTLMQRHAESLMSTSRYKGWEVVDIELDQLDLAIEAAADKAFG